jgi:hypothetical protein
MHTILYTGQRRMTTTLPSVFAIYRPETETFQLLQPDIDLTGSVIGLKNWALPGTVEWKKASLAEQKQMLPWFRGQEWYALPTLGAGSDEPIQIYTSTIHSQPYQWWSLRHKLVWSNYLTFGKRNGILAHEWNVAPSVILIDFHTKLIYPRAMIGFYPRWTDTTPQILMNEVRHGLSAVAPTQATTEAVNERANISMLRIKTPPARDSDDEFETNTEERIQRAPRHGIMQQYDELRIVNAIQKEGMIHKYLSVSIIIFMGLAAIGLYTFIAMVMLGY